MFCLALLPLLNRVSQSKHTYFHSKLLNFSKERVTTLLYHVSRLFYLLFFPKTACLCRRNPVARTESDNWLDTSLRNFISFWLRKKPQHHNINLWSSAPEEHAMWVLFQQLEDDLIYHASWTLKGQSVQQPHFPDPTTQMSNSTT